MTQIDTDNLRDRELIRAGMMKAAAIINQGAREHDMLAEKSVTLASKHGADFAAAILRAYAEGLEVRASNEGDIDDAHAKFVNAERDA